MGEPGSMNSEPVLVEPAPVSDGVGDELGTIVEPHVDRCGPALGSEAIQDRNDTVGIDGAIDLDRQALRG